MAISFNTGTTGSLAAAAHTTNFTFTVPSGVLTGDVMFLVLDTFTFTPTTYTVSTPSSGGGSWTIIPTTSFVIGSQGGGLSTGQGAWYRVATASDPGSTLTVSWTGSTPPTDEIWWTGALTSYTGASNSSPIDVSGQSSGLTLTTIGACPNETTGVANDWAIYLCAAAVSSSGTITGIPASSTSRENKANAGVNAAIADSNGSVGGVGTGIGGGSFTGSASATWSVFTVGLAPSSGAAAPSGTVQPRATVPVPRRTPARALWRGGSGQAYVAVAAPRQQPAPAPRRKPARAVWHGNTGQAYVAVPAPPQQPHTWPRRTPARAYIRGTPLVTSNAAPVTATISAGPAVGVLPYAGGIMLQSLSQTFTVSGSWTTPAGIIGAPAVYAWGPSGTAASGTAGTGAGGGGGGSFGGEPALGGVTPGTTLTVTIGAAGSGSASTVTGGSVTVTGNAGGNATTGTGGSAGAASTNTVAFAGGSGGNGVAGGSGGGGGGGGSAGSTGAGGNGNPGVSTTGGTGGTAGTGAAGLTGAAGGNGGTASNGAAGTAPGGAGGGGSGGATHTGGAASAGQAVIFWQVLTPVPMAMQRRVLTRARVQSRPVQTTNTVAVPAPVQQPRTWPRRVPSRAVVQFTPVRTTNNTAFVSVPAPVQQPRPAPRRTPARAFIQFRPVRTTNAAPAILLGTPPTIPTSGGDRSPTIRVFREIRPGDVPASGAQMPRLTGRAFAVPIPVDTDHTTHAWDETPDEPPPVPAGPSLLDQARTELDELAKTARDAADAIDRAADRARPIVEGIGSRAYDLGKIFGSQPYDPRPRKVCGSTHMAGGIVLTCQRKPHDDGWHSDKGLHWR